MNYIVLDLEWNQGVENLKEENYLNFEVIEIGATKLNNDRAIISKFSQIIKPQVHHELHNITSKLIHMQMEELENGRPFVEVMQEFLEWCGKDYVFCTWGPLDLTELQKNMKYYGMEPLKSTPFRFYDVQKLFSMEFEDGKSRRSLEYAVDYLEIEKDIPFHRAYSDAYYTGKVFERIRSGEVLEKYSYDIFNPPQNRKEEVTIIFSDYAKYISRVFDEKQEAMTDRGVTSCKCYLCHKNLKKKVRWFTPNGKHYYCVAICDIHGYMKGKIRIRKTDEDKIYIVKTTKFVGEEEVKKIEIKQEHAKDIRKKRRQKF